MEGVSIIICTYNRAELLHQCLRSFTLQNQISYLVEFIVIDNGSTDSTQVVTSSFYNKLPALRLVTEKNIGLSYARNRGINEAIYEWVCYVDDDAKVHTDFVERLFYVIHNFDFDAFGGMFYPWYRTPKPDWFPNDFGKMVLLRETTGPLKYGQSIAGGISAFKKSELIKAGCFPTDIGMRGNIVGYGEEDHVIRKMWENNNIIGFDPYWKMDHLVAEYKYTLCWQLKRSFAKGRDAQLKQQRLDIKKKIVLLIKALLTIPYLFLKNTFSFFGRRYYLQNYILDSLRYSFRMFGKVSV